MILCLQRGNMALAAVHFIPQEFAEMLNDSFSALYIIKIFHFWLTIIINIIFAP